MEFINVQPTLRESFGSHLVEEDSIIEQLAKINGELVEMVASHGLTLLEHFTTHELTKIMIQILQSKFSMDDFVAAIEYEAVTRLQALTSTDIPNGTHLFDVDTRKERFELGRCIELTQSYKEERNAI